MNKKKISIDFKDNNGLSQIALIGTIVGIIIVISLVVVLVVFSGKGKEKQNENNQNETVNENNDFFSNTNKNEIDDKNEKEKDDKEKEYLSKDGVKIEELYDSTGEEEEKLHIGDFVDYTAGKWTEDEIEKIDANGERKKPTTSFKFGGYKEGDSRDKSVIPCNENFNYIKEKDSDDENVACGWRVFDITDDEIVLISAGCPEDYYHPAEGRSAYISQYILTGEVNENCRAEWIGLGTKYQKRTWNEYVNEDYYATKATSISKTILDDWYEKYIGRGLDTWKNEDFQKVYDTNYENLIDNYSYYWLPNSYSESNIYGFFPHARVIGNSTNKYGNVFGVRILVYLPKDIKFKEESIGTKTILSRDKDYKYNIWEISR